MPANPDTRPLPDGWVEEFDEGRQKWFYKQISLNPPRVSYMHPLGPLRPTVAIKRNSTLTADNGSEAQSPKSTTSSEANSIAQQMYRHASALASASSQSPLSSSQVNLPPHMRRVLSDTDPGSASGGRLTPAQQLASEVRGSSLRSSSTSPRLTPPGLDLNGPREVFTVLHATSQNPTASNSGASYDSSPPFYGSSFTMTPAPPSTNQSIYRPTETYQSNQMQPSLQSHQVQQTAQISPQQYTQHIPTTPQVPQHQSAQPQPQQPNQFSAVRPQQPSQAFVPQYQTQQQRPSAASVPQLQLSPPQPNGQPAHSGPSTMQMLQGAFQVAKLGYEAYEAIEHPKPSGAHTTGGGGVEAVVESGLAALFHSNGGGTGGTNTNTSAGNAGSTAAANHGQTNSGAASNGNGNDAFAMLLAQAQQAQAQGGQNNQNADNGNILSALLQQGQGGQNNQNTDGGNMFFGQTPAGQNDQSGGTQDFGAFFGQAQGGQSDQWGGSNDGYNPLMQGAMQVNAGDGNTNSGYNVGY